MAGNGYNVNKGESAGDIGASGKVDKSKPSFKEGENINASVPKLKQIGGVKE